MKITFSNAALSITVEDDSEYTSAVEVLEALKAFRLIEIKHTPVAAGTEGIEITEVSEPVAEVPAAVASETPATPVNGPTIESVYGPGYEWPNGDDNPVLGFRQPVVGDIFLDPDVMAPRKKTTPAEYGPRLILTYR